MQFIIRDINILIYFRQLHMLFDDFYRRFCVKKHAFWGRFRHRFFLVFVRRTIGTNKHIFQNIEFRQGKTYKYQKEGRQHFDGSLHFEATFFLSAAASAIGRFFMFSGGKYLSTSMSHKKNAQTFPGCMKLI